MTLIIAAKGKEHILLGADSRAVRQDRAGTRILTDMHDKLILLNKFNCLLIAGDAERGIYLIENFKEQIDKKDDIKSIVKKFVIFCRKEFRGLLNFINIESSYYPEIVFILAGFENIKGKTSKPRLYIIRSKSAFQPGEKREYIIEGKKTISEYLFAKEYKIDMTADQLSKLTFQCFYDTEKIDGEAGGEIHLATLDNKYGFNDIDTKELEEDIDLKDIRKIMEGV